MGNMTTAQFAALLVAIIGGQFGVLFYLSGRIDRIGDDLKQFYRSLGQHEARLDGLERK